MKKLYKYEIGDIVLVRVLAPALSCEMNGRSNEFTGKIVSRTRRRGWREYGFKGMALMYREDEIKKRIRRNVKAAKGEKNG